MREPKFSDAWCFGKAFEATSKICHVCLANKQCQKKFYKSLGATGPEAAPLLALTAADNDGEGGIRLGERASR
jgi:hypothetical protein